MNRKIIKKNAKKIIKKNYLQCLVVSFFISLIIGGSNFTPIREKAFSVLNNPLPISLNSNITLDFIEHTTHLDLKLSSYKPTRGFLASVFNNITASKSFVFGILNSINQFVFHNRIVESFIILFGALLSFIYWLFIKNIFVVGEKRFYLENVYHPKTTFNRTLLPYKVKKVLNVSLAIFRKSLFELLWAFTIIGGFIKHYAYAMIPFILAENPGIKPKDAMELSKKLMQNHKFELFKFDLSFILLSILDLFTFHLLYIFYLKPYKQSCLAEIYLNYKKEAQEKKVENINLLNDEYLTIPEDKYPQNKYIYKEAESRKWLNTTNYNKTYKLDTLILFFFTASIIGFLWETGFHLFQYGSFVKRGTMHGPWIPIYGWGVVMLLVILKKYREHPWKTFIFSIIICGFIEYFTSLYLEVFKHARWWDYDGFFLNIHGRICLEGLLAFGIGGCVFIYFIAPILDNLYQKINPKIKTIICILLTLCYIVDLGYSSINPNSGVGVNTEIKDKNTP